MTIKYKIPHFVIKNKYQKNLQKKFSDIITYKIMKKLSIYFTKSEQFTYEFIDEVNVGRLGKLYFENQVIYITFSETDYKKGRNSAVQSAPSALTQYYSDENVNKKMAYYFLDSIGNRETEYFSFIYRLLMTSGVLFVNSERLSFILKPFLSVKDIVASRNMLRKKQNNSSYISIDENGNIEVFAKTYGANKKEATMICLAIANISNKKIVVYEMIEKNLKKLPKPDVKVLKKLGIRFIRVDRELEEKEYVEKDSLRSPRFVLNMLMIHGAKKCAVCDCNIPQIIEAAHIWPVANIKRHNELSRENQLNYATDGNNGIWLCRNHHRLFDSNILTINSKYQIEFKNDSEFDDESESYLKASVSNINLSTQFVSNTSKKYLHDRNINL